MDDSYSFGVWVGRRRRALRLTQHEVAGMVICSLVLIQKIEADARRPSEQIAARLATVLQMPPELKATFVRVARAELTANRLPAPDAGVRAMLIADLTDHPTLPAQPVGNLPNQVSSFHGRTRELGDLRLLIQEKAKRLTTLTGTGGSGKTRLALQVADQLQYAFPAGIWFIDLSPVSDPHQIVSAIAQTLGIAASTERPLREAVLHWLHQRQILLLLDNCEQVIAGVAELVAELLRRTSLLSVLATSRIPLRIAGEWEYAVAPLAVPDSGAVPPLEHLSQVDSVALFITRARAVRADFALTASNAPAVTAICTRLDGLPLAIELAAARIRLFPPEHLLSRLDTHGALGMLTGGTRDLASRQRTIRATIEWSYRLLDLSQQLLLARLSVFVGGWTLAAAEAICSDPAGSVIEGLAALVEQSLVHRQEAPGEPRYSMLETIREYALERLAELGEVQGLHAFHAQFFTELAEAAEPGLYSADAQRLLGILRPDIDNLRAALTWSIANAPDLAGRLSAAILEFWSTSIHLFEGVNWVKRALVRRSEMLPLVRAKLAMVAAFMQQGSQPIPGIDALYQESITIYRECGDQPGLARALAYYGSYFTRATQNQNSEPFLDESLQLAQTLNLPWIVTWATFWKGWNCYDTSRIEEAQQYWRQALSLYTEMGYLRGQASSLLALGVAAFALGEYQRVWQFNKQRFHLDQLLSNSIGMADCLMNMSRASLAQHRYTDAEQSLREALRFIPVEFSFKFHLWLSYTLAQSGQVNAARDVCQRAYAQQTADTPQMLSYALLTCVAAIMAADGQALASARLCGFIEQHKAADPVPENLWETSPEQERWLNPVRHLARKQLSAEEWESAWEVGRKLSWEQAADEALAWLEG